MKRIFVWGVMVLIAALAVLYAGDWVVLRIRMGRQAAFSSVQVNQFLVAQLKGHRQEYFHMGIAQQPCVKAIFPHESDPPCWWVRWHALQWNVAGLMIFDARDDTTGRDGGEASRYTNCDGMKYSSASRSKTKPPCDDKAT